MRQTTLLVQTGELEAEVRQTCQKIVDLSDAYAGLIEHVDYQLSETQAEKEEHASRMRGEADLEAEQLRQQARLIESLQEQLRLRDLEWGRVRAHRDKQVNQEKLRLQMMADRGCEVMKAIQEDEMRAKPHKGAFGYSQVRASQSIASNNTTELYDNLKARQSIAPATLLKIASQQTLN